MNYRYAAALTALALPSSLSAQAINLKLDQTLVENFDGTAVADALIPFNATLTQAAGKDGAPFYKIVFPNKLSAQAQPDMCKDDTAHTGCTGLLLSAVFDLPEGKTAADMAQVVNSFNYSHPASQVVRAEDGKTRLTHFVIADFGITKTNFVIQLYNFRESASAFSELLFAPPAKQGS